MPGYSFQRKLRKLSRDEHGQRWLAKIKQVINTLSHQGKERNSQNVAIISRLSCQQHCLQENLVFACKPCIYSPPWHTWGKEKKNPHNFTCIAFFFLHLAAGWLRKFSERRSSLYKAGQQWTQELSFSFCPRQGLAAHRTLPAAPCVFNSGSLLSMINFSEKQQEK